VFYGDYTDCPHTPLFSFGHGLGYTTFGYSDITVEAGDTASPVSVGVTVANTGNREGEEVVQLYVSDLVASVARPETYLIGFTRLSLAPGEAARVTFDVHPSRLAFYDEAMRFVLEPGLFRFAVGTSSSDIRQEAVVEITGPVAQYSQRSVVAVAAQVGRQPAVRAMQGVSP
jgi:beta-glucosidase